MRGKRRDGTPGLGRGWGMSFCKSYLGFYTVDVVAPIVLFQEVGGVQLIF
jgi:hypothetical protein